MWGSFVGMGHVQPTGRVVLFDWEQGGMGLAVVGKLMSSLTWSMAHHFTLTLHHLS